MEMRIWGEDGKSPTQRRVFCGSTILISFLLKYAPQSTKAVVESRASLKVNGVKWRKCRKVIVNTKNQLKNFCSGGPEILSVAMINAHNFTKALICTSFWMTAKWFPIVSLGQRGDFWSNDTCITTHLISTVNAKECSEMPWVAVLRSSFNNNNDLSSDFVTNTTVTSTSNRNSIVRPTTYQHTQDNAHWYQKASSRRLSGDICNLKLCTPPSKLGNAYCQLLKSWKLVLFIKHQNTNRPHQQILSIHCSITSLNSTDSSTTTSHLGEIRLNSAAETIILKLLYSTVNAMKSHRSPREIFLGTINSPDHHKGPSRKHKSPFIIRSSQTCR